MHLVEQDAKPQCDSIAVHVRLKRKSCYDACPQCSRQKKKSSLMCKDCRLLDGKPPIDPKVYLVAGIPCRRIPLTRDKYALVYETDYAHLMQWVWCAYMATSGGWYAQRRPRGADEGASNIHLHRFIVGNVDAPQVDHANGNGLDCRRANLRACSKIKNGKNRGKLSHSKNRFKGVRTQPTSKRNPWIAQITVNTEKKYLGCFSTEEAAARTYDAAAIAYFGEFAWLNFPPNPPLDTYHLCVL